MQLFITDFEKKWNNISIQNKEILDQVRKVLRMKIWDHIFVQQENIRHQIEISDRDDKNLYWNILATTTYDWKKSQDGILVALSNKRDKIELIAQKLTEIWIKNIYLRPSERSIIRERNDKKLERIQKISKEAVEQSRWRFLPEIQFTKDISEIIKNREIIVFDKSEWKTAKFRWHTPLLWIIGPEWWLTPNDYKSFGNNIKTVSLGDTVLRTETASIIAARNIINNKF